MGAEVVIDFIVFCENENTMGFRHDIMSAKRNKEKRNVRKDKTVDNDKPSRR